MYRIIEFKTDAGKTYFIEENRPEWVKIKWFIYLKKSFWYNIASSSSTMKEAMDKLEKYKSELPKYHYIK